MAIKSLLKNIVTGILRWEARVILNKYKPKIITVTGNVGKTSTKDAIFYLLTENYNIRRSEKSYNSELGVPLTVLDQKSGWSSMFSWTKIIISSLKLFFTRLDYPKWLVLEVGADHPGDIKNTASWLQSDVVVITRLPEVPVHIQFFKDKEEVIEEKLSLLNSLKKDGVAILNADDQILSSRINTNSAGFKVVTYGFGDKADIKAVNLNIIYNENKLPIGIKFDVQKQDEIYPMYLKGLLGRHQVYSILASIAVAISIDDGVSLKEIIGILEKNYILPPGRMRLLTGINNSLILDDTYNSSPEAVKSAISSISSLDHTKRKIAVLGDMLELGQFTEQAHREIGQKVSQVFDILITVGNYSKFINEEAVSSGMNSSSVFHFSDSATTGLELQKMIQSGDLILVKGSQGIRMEKIVALIMTDVSNKNDLLCRQDAEWSVK